MKGVSVIICTKDRPYDLQRLLNSIARQTYKEIQLIVVNGGNVSVEEQVKDTVLLLKKMIRDINWIHTKPGLTLQRNIGIGQAKCPILIFFDDDIILESDCIEQFVKAFQLDLSIGAVCGRIKNIRDDRYKISRIKLFLYRMFQRVFALAGDGNGRFKYSTLATNPHLIEESRYIECLSGCCMAFRQSVFQGTGVSFDPFFVGYCYREDVEISKQVLSKGWKIYYAANARLQHLVSCTARLQERDAAKMLVENSFYIYTKHWRKSFFRTLAFHWAMLGYVIESLILKRFGRVIGIMEGIIKVNFSKRFI